MEEEWEKIWKDDEDAAKNLYGYTAEEKQRIREMGNMPWVKALMDLQSEMESQIMQGTRDLCRLWEVRMRAHMQRCVMLALEDEREYKEAELAEWRSEKMEKMEKELQKVKEECEEQKKEYIKKWEAERKKYEEEKEKWEREKEERVRWEKANGKRMEEKEEKEED